MTASPTRRQLVFLLGSLLLAPLVTLYATQAVWLQSLWAPLPWMASHGGATVLFWVLFSSLSLTLYGFFRRLFPAYLPEVAVFMGVAVTSRYKLDINGAPLQLSDFAFVGNLGDITGYAASQLIPTLTTLLAIGVAAVLTETLRRKETWRPSLTQGFVLGSLCLTLFLSALYPGALQSAALRLDQNSPDQETRNERMGVVLGLYTAWAQRLQVETGTADPETTRLVDQLRADAMGPGTPAPAAAPDIIFVTSESFFDVTRLPGLTFSQDPLPNFHRLSETCTNGPFLSNTYGGGTGHVEMEMFTGLTSSLLKEGDTLNTLHTAVYQDLPTTVRLLQKAGYATTALHAHTSELYNRETIYPAIGFDTVAPFWTTSSPPWRSQASTPPTTPSPGNSSPGMKPGTPASRSFCTACPWRTTRPTPRKSTASPRAFPPSATSCPRRTWPFWTRWSWGCTTRMPPWGCSPTTSPRWTVR